jgi:polyphosphate glucokinase
MRVLSVDVGGRHVKALVQGESDRRRFRSSPELTPGQMVEGTLELVDGWDFDHVSVGVPAPVHDGKVVRDPVNLGPGWQGFDYEAAFGRPTKVVNDAAMQALGSYEGTGTMLFLGLGTGLGSTLISDGAIEPLELGHLPFKKLTFEDYVGERGRKRFGTKHWKKLVAEAVAALTAALEPDYVVLGGGNALKLDELPPNAKLGSNSNAFAGAFKIWEMDT